MKHFFFFLAMLISVAGISQIPTNRGFHGTVNISPNVQNSSVPNADYNLLLQFNDQSAEGYVAQDAAIGDIIWSNAQDSRYNRYLVIALNVNGSIINADVLDLDGVPPTGGQGAIMREDVICTSFTIGLPDALQDAIAAHCAQLDSGKSGAPQNLSYDPITDSLSITDGNAVAIPDDQDLDLTNNLLSISGGNSVSLIPYLDNTDNQRVDAFSLTGTTLNLSLEGDNQTVRQVELSSINTDNQTLNLVGSTLSISGGNSIELPEFVNTDNQSVDIFSLVDNKLSISLERDGVLPFVVNLDQYLDNTDNQTLTLVGSTLSISGGNSVELQSFTDTDDQTLALANDNLSISEGNTVSLSPYLDNTDNQQIDVFGLVGDELNLSITGDNQVAQTVDFSRYLDNTDNQVADEFQIVGDMLRLSLSEDNEPTKEVDLSTYLDNTDNQNIDLLELNGGTLSISLAGDGLPPATVDIASIDTDEQTLDLLNNTLSISGGNAVDLSPYLDNTDNQTLSLIDGVLSISGGNSVSLIALDSDTDEQQLILDGYELAIERGNTITLPDLVNYAILTSSDSTLAGSVDEIAYRLGSLGIGVRFPNERLHVLNNIRSTEGSMHVDNNRFYKVKLTNGLDWPLLTIDQNNAAILQGNLFTNITAGEDSGVRIAPNRSQTTWDAGEPLRIYNDSDFGNADLLFTFRKEGDLEVKNRIIMGGEQVSTAPFIVTSQGPNNALTYLPIDSIALSFTDSDNQQLIFNNGFLSITNGNVVNLSSIQDGNLSNSDQPITENRNVPITNARLLIGKNETGDNTFILVDETTDEIQFINNGNIVSGVDNIPTDGSEYAQQVLNNAGGVINNTASNSIIANAAEHTFLLASKEGYSHSAIVNQFPTGLNASQKGAKILYSKVINATEYVAEYQFNGLNWIPTNGIDLPQYSNLDDAEGDLASGDWFAATVINDFGCKYLDILQVP